MDWFNHPYSQRLNEIGMDSIVGMEIATGIERTLGLRISAVELASGPSIEPAKSHTPLQPHQNHPIIHRRACFSLQCDLCLIAGAVAAVK
jgi:hypothetical protein